mmetsp:Transcript_12026/g.32394  ORF Transcript_12026/g.32394 Transcript_12026/m.32394 type:complete len:239 (+) Transcript_12026:1284-2000(+)
MENRFRTDPVPPPIAGAASAPPAETGLPTTRSLAPREAGCEFCSVKRFFSAEAAGLFAFSECVRAMDALTAGRSRISSERYSSSPSVLMPGSMSAFRSCSFSTLIACACFSTYSYSSSFSLSRLFTSCSFSNTESESCFTFAFDAEIAASADGASCALLARASSRSFSITAIFSFISAMRVFFTSTCASTFVIDLLCFCSFSCSASRIFSRCSASATRILSVFGSSVSFSRALIVVEL